MIEEWNAHDASATRMKVSAHSSRPDLFVVFNADGSQAGTVQLALATSSLPPVGWLAPLLVQVVTREDEPA